MKNISRLIIASIVATGISSALIGSTLRLYVAVSGENRIAVYREIGDDGIVVAQFPLKYDKDKKKISVDTKVLQKMLSVPPAQAQNIDWVALAGGGAVGVRDRTGSNNLYLLKSVSDLIFKGSGVALERKGKDIELTFTDTGTYNESTTPPSSPSDGDRWHETDSGKLFTYSNAQSVWIEF